MITGDLNDTFLVESFHRLYSSLASEQKGDAPSCFCKSDVTTVHVVSKVLSLFKDMGATDVEVDEARRKLNADAAYFTSATHALFMKITMTCPVTGAKRCQCEHIFITVTGVVSGRRLTLCSHFASSRELLAY